MQPRSSNGTQIRIRPAQHGDLPSILAIYNDAVLHTTASYDYEPATLEARVVWYDEHVKEGFPVFVADDDGSIVGWSSLSDFRQRAGYRHTVEDSVYVAADRRGQGIGRMLVAPLISSALDLGMHALIAGIDADSAASIRLHASFGFVQVAHFKEVGYKFGRWLDVVFMELMLS